MIADLKNVEPGKPHRDPTGTINHLRLTVSDIPRAKAFYMPLLQELGYQFVEESQARLAWASWAPHGLLQWVIMSVADRTSLNRAHDRYSPGFHHLAWNVRSREDVDRLYVALLDRGVAILDPPAEYDFEPGYYAFFFADPDGLKLEIIHVPIEGSLSYWQEFSERGEPRASPENTEPAFLRE
jgi:catechol 2,3-dioxygenase-like lactoylglutathione lyase family enzyme